MRLTRLPDWPERLAATIERARSCPFAWGQCDCVSFAAACVFAVTGVDVMDRVRGGWSSADTAARLLRRRGGLMVAVSRALGPARLDHFGARRGDVIFVPAGRPHVAVCDGANWWSPGRSGLVTGSMGVATAHWPVGW